MAQKHQLPGTPPPSTSVTCTLGSLQLLHPSLLHHFEKSLIYLQNKPILFILAQLFPQALRWCCCPQGDESLRLSPSLPGASGLRGLLVLRVLLSWGSRPPWPVSGLPSHPCGQDPAAFFPLLPPTKGFSSSPSAETTQVCVMSLISQVTSPLCLLHVFLLFSTLLCVAMMFLSPLSSHQNTDQPIC